jgi:SET domain-containing protein
MFIPITVGISPTLKIRGVLAAKDIKKGQVIERCPVVLMNAKHDSYVDHTALKNYYYEWNKKYSAVVLGYGSLYNHSYTPNAQYVYNYHKKLMVYRALKDIKKGEEIFINYNYFPRSRKKLDPGLVSKDKTYYAITS